MKRLALTALLALAACREESAELPAPVAMTEEAVGYYCQMDLLEHPGPKAQVHLKDMPVPLFFAQVRDAVAYQRMPEQSHDIVAIYVSDMDHAPGWDDPGAENWITADAAHFVLGSESAGGMGAEELVPFGTLAGAEAFAAEHGGRVVSLSAIPDSAVLAPAEPVPGSGTDAAGDEGDYLTRLRALTERNGS